MMPDAISDLAKLRIGFHPPMYADYTKDTLYFLTLNQADVFNGKKSVFYHLAID